MPTALVTGASRGIGKELCRQLGAAGWNVVACCRVKREVEGAASVEALDVSSDASVAALARRLGDEFAVDVVINNAGVTGNRHAGVVAAHVDAPSWQEVFNTNVLGPARVTEALLPALKRGERKLVVHISSGLGSIKSVSDQARGAGGVNDLPGASDVIYRSSKAALNMVSACMALEGKRDGVASVALHPGWVDTDMGSRNGAVKPPLTVEASAAGLVSVIQSLTLADTGKFIDWTGKELAF